MIGKGSLFHIPIPIKEETVVLAPPNTTFESLGFNDS